MIEQSILPCKRPKVERAKLSQNAICMLYAVAAKAPEGRRNIGRGIAPVKADGTKAPEGRQIILLLLEFTGAMPLQDDWCSPLSSVAPPGLLWVGCLYRGDAPACILSPLRGYCGGCLYRGDAPACIPPPLRGYCGGCLYRGAAPACLPSPLRGYCGGCLYRGDAPACILSPLRGFCVHHNRPRSTLSIARYGIVYTIAIERKPQNYILPSLTGRGWGRVCCGGGSAVGEGLLWGCVFFYFPHCSSRKARRFLNQSFSVCISSS